MGEDMFKDLPPELLESIPPELIEELKNPTESPGVVQEELNIGTSISIEDLYMLVLIQTQRIYDLLAIQIELAGGSKALDNIVNIHNQGRYLSPEPSIGEQTDK